MKARVNWVRRIEDPESFYDELEPGCMVVLDEVHRLEDPSRVLRIAAKTPYTKRYQGQLLGTYSVQGEILSNYSKKKKTKKKSRRAKKKAA